MLALVAIAAARPTEGGQFSFDASDVVTSYDSPAGAVRVWYSTDGPNAVRLDDGDATGVPDFVENVGATAEDVLATYAAAGFRPPVSDETGGGSPAMDAYLVDFGGSADGHYAAESCEGEVCSGYFVMENDFEGYGYGDLDEAIRVLTSHELFHAVQAAYDAETESWFSEGTAVWAERLYDPDSADFIGFCGEYLQDPGRSLDEPPAGPVPTFAYSTALWWSFLSTTYGDDVVVALLERSGEELLPAMVDIQEARGGTLAEDWTTFARWNLATGSRAGAAESHAFAAELRTFRIDDDESSLADDVRFYPLAASYFAISHPGGPLRFGIDEPAPNLAFSLHAEDAEGRSTEAVTAFSGAATDLGDHAEGVYFLVGANPTLDDQSTKRDICLGPDCEVPDPVAELPCGCAGPASPGILALLFTVRFVRIRR